VREADRAMRISLSEAVSRLMRVGPMKSWTSPRVKGVVFGRHNYLALLGVTGRNWALLGITGRVALLGLTGRYFHFTV
jgi:hypothetical protein